MSDDLIPAQLVVPDQELVQQILDQLELAYTVDEKGELLTAWPGFRIYYQFEGERRELFSIRAFYDRTYPAESKPQLLDALDDWNRDTLWPKVYTHVDLPDGMLRVIGELELLIGSGVGLGSFGAMTENFTFSAVAFEDWLIERLELETGDEAAAEDEDDEEDVFADAEDEDDEEDVFAESEDEDDEEDVLADAEDDEEDVFADAENEDDEASAPQPAPAPAPAPAPKSTPKPKPKRARSR